MVISLLQLQKPSGCSKETDMDNWLKKWVSLFSSKTYKNRQWVEFIPQAIIFQSSFLNNCRYFFQVSTICMYYFCKCAHIHNKRCRIKISKLSCSDCSCFCIFSTVECFFLLIPQETIGDMNHP